MTKVAIWLEGMETVTRLETTTTIVTRTGTRTGTIMATITTIIMATTNGESVFSIPDEATSIKDAKSAALVLLDADLWKIVNIVTG